MTAIDDIETAEELMKAGFSLDGLDALHDAQRLIGPIIGYYVLLRTATGSPSVEERRKAAKALVKEVSEDPEQIADRIRQSAFKDLSLDELEAVVATGELDPERAVEKFNGGDNGND